MVILTTVEQKDVYCILLQKTQYNKNLFWFPGFCNKYIRFLCENVYCWWCLQGLFTNLEILSVKFNLIVWTVTRVNLSNLNLEIFLVWKETISPQKMKNYFFFCKRLWSSCKNYIFVDLKKIFKLEVTRESYNGLNSDENWKE